MGFICHLVFDNVRSLRALWSFNDVEGYALAFVQGFETVALDSTEVHKYIIGTFDLNETEWVIYPWSG